MLENRSLRTMIMCCIKATVLVIIVFLLQPVHAQDNFTGYLQPQLSMNYNVTHSYSHNFSLTHRNYLYAEEKVAIYARHIDIAHFSELKIRNNQSLAFGIQYRFREAFEANEENELRFTQQYNLTFKPRVVRFGHRLRIEQRIRTSLTIHRFRYRFTTDFPLEGEQLDLGETYFIASTESLLSAAKANKSEYDQRFTAQFGFLISEETKFQIGMEYRFEDFTHETEQIIFLLSSLIFNF